jgi:hypothetical protein
MSNNYYRNELEKLDCTGEYFPTIVISDSKGNKTKHLSLTNECITVLVLWLLELQKSERA